ncbi:MAG: hypothetical protein J0I16_03580 [Rhizobiales bacterium]|nr:hypothetical protein [Hyphomicrobiales bacterium]
MSAVTVFKHVERLLDRPIITQDMVPSNETNINGPSLIRVPSWVRNPLGRYYLYFSSHFGDHIRLAYADALTGPWRLHAPGVLHLNASHFNDHIASPDVTIDQERQEIRLYYHGVVGDVFSDQRTRVALSNDGLMFEAQAPIVMDWYSRAFRWNGMIYALTMPGTMWRSPDGIAPFERGPSLFTPRMRHSAVRVRGHELDILYTNCGDNPESILATTLDLRSDWLSWRAEPSTLLIQPERAYEGGDLPPAPSERGGVRQAVRQLRDPAFFEEAGKTYLLYAGAGESGICLAELHT